MSKKNALQLAVEKLIREHGKEEVLSAAESVELHDAKSQQLTILCNKGMHPVPTEIVRGELFVASEGNLNFSTPKDVESEIESILSRTAQKIRSRAWQEIYIIPHGHVVISMQIKFLCYRILGVETIDWFYLSSLGYVRIKFSPRDLLVPSN